MNRVPLAYVIIVVSTAAIGNVEATAQTASNYHTWVASTGVDNNACGSLAAPCRSLAYAVAKTYPGGELQCVDAVDNSVATITKSLTISCDQSKWSNAFGVSLFGTPLTVTTAANDVVTFRGLSLDGARSGFTGIGINFNGAGTLVLDNVQITGFVTNGILMQPTGTGRLVVSNSLLASNGNFNDNTGAGIRISPQSGGSAQVSISRTDVSRNVFGIAADGSNSTAGINLTITDSVSSANVQDGFIAVSTGAPAAMFLTNSKSLNNGFGIRSIGSNITVRAEGSKIVGNGVGLSGGGALLSGGGNTVQANGANGAFTGSYAQQ